MAVVALQISLIIAILNHQNSQQFGFTKTPNLKNHA